MNKEISDKIIENAVNKPVKSLLNTVDNLLVLVVVINRQTGKVLDIVSKPSLLTGNLTVQNFVEKDLNVCYKEGCDKRVK